MRAHGATAAAAALLLIGLAGWLIPYDPVLDVDPARATASASWAHPLAFDRLGRDVLRRLLAATPAALGPGAVAIAVAGALGAIPGVVAGSLGGSLGRALLLPLEAVGSIPRFVLIVLIAAASAHSPLVLGAATGAAYAPTLADALRAQVERLRAVGWVEATRAHGVSWPALWLHDLLAGACRPVLAVHALRLLAFGVVVETSLAYLGHFGVQEPAASWGNQLALSMGHAGNAWAWAAPGLAILAAVGTLQAAAWRVAEAYDVA